MKCLSFSTPLLSLSSSPKPDMALPLPRSLSFLSLVLILLVHFAGLDGLLVRFDKVPSARTRFTTAVFVYKIQDATGHNPCLDAGSCSLSCELDGGLMESCPIGVIELTNLTPNHEHKFHLNATTSMGDIGSSLYRWFIDTLPPTATLSSKTSFTNAASITVDISFSEPCIEGFTCLEPSKCDVAVTGPATIDISTLQVVEPDTKYRVGIMFSNTLYGRVVVRMADKFCSDEAGNLFQRTNSSVTIIHFDRREVNVDFWTLVPSYELQIGQVLRTVLATNNVEELKIFLDFSDSVLNSTQEILSAMEASTGNLVPIASGSHANRRFAFQLEKLEGSEIVTVKLQSSSLVGRSGSRVTPVKPIVFLYDSTKPGVRLTTNTQGPTAEPIIHVMIEFTKPVFGFDSSRIEVGGGSISRFKEHTKTLYSTTITLTSENEVSVVVPDGKVPDIAGNLNMASNQLRVEHYSTPPTSIALHSFITAGLLATSFTATLLAIAASNLATMSDHCNWDVLFSSPSGNLLGCVGHIQVLVLSDWLSVSLPVEYSETTKGLRWLIPRERLPWKKMGTQLWPQHFMDDNKKLNNVPSDMKPSPLRPRKIASPSTTLIDKVPFLPSHCPNWTSSMEKEGSSSHCRSWSGGLHSNPNVSMMDAAYGLPLESSEYFVYFMNGEPLSAANIVKKMEHYTGWEDFKMNMLWLGVFSGALFAAHILMVLLMRWRMGKSIRGPLSVPRFELFLLALMLPCLCQSPAFLLRGGTTGGIIVGSLILAIPIAFLLSVALFLAFAIFNGNFVQYKEIEKVYGNVSWIKWSSSYILGQSTRGMWIQKETGSSFLSRFGILFENRKGPVILVRADSNDPSNPLEWTSSGLDGIGRMRALSSEDGDRDQMAMATMEKLLGQARTVYILLDLARRVGLGFVAGAYSKTQKHNSSTQLFIAFGLTIVQLLYLMTLKPYIRRGIHAAESTSLACEAGIFGLSFYLDHWNTYDRDGRIGAVMLALLFITFACQLVNEWHAFISFLLHIPETHNPSLRKGLKWALRGLFLLFIPKKNWSRLFSGSNKLPTTGLVPVVPMNFDSEADRSTRAGAMTATVVPLSSPEPRSNIQYQPIRRMVDAPQGRTEGPALGPSTQSGRLAYKAEKMKMVEEKRPRSWKMESRGEMRQLQKMAMATFPGGIAKDGEGSSSHTGRDQISSESFTGKL